MTDTSIDRRVADVRFDEHTLFVTLKTGETVAAPLSDYPRLQDAMPAQRASWQPSAAGYGVHWPDIDENIDVERLDPIPK